MDYKKVMTNKLKLALIPARAGSKGIIDKNIVDLDGKPLMNWSIEVALNSKLFDVVCVSTDSSEIAHIARNAGAEVPFLRPIEISEDKSLQIDVIKHCLQFYQNRHLEFNSITLLQPTSPFRKIEDLASSLELFSHKNYETLISVKNITEFADSACYSSKIDNNSLELLPLKPVPYNEESGTLRQNFEKKYWRNGSIYIFKPANILVDRKLIKDPIVGFEMPWKRSINIDSYADLEIARLLARQNLKEIYG